LHFSVRTLVAFRTLARRETGKRTAWVRGSSRGHDHAVPRSACPNLPAQSRDAMHPWMRIAVALPGKSAGSAELSHGPLVLAGSVGLAPPKSSPPGFTRE